MFAKTGRARIETRGARVGLLQNVGTGDVHRHEVWRELNTTELQRHRLSEFADEQCFSETWNTHQQRVAAREQADRQLLDHFLLANDDSRQFSGQFSVGVAQTIDRLHIIVRHPRNRFTNRLTHCCLSCSLKSPHVCADSRRRDVRFPQFSQGIL